MKNATILLLTLVLSLGFYPLAHGAVGDVVADCQDITTGARLDIQPAGSDEWIIHNLVFDANITLERYDGTLTAIGPSFIGPDWQNFSPGFHVDNTDRLRIVNDDAGTQTICYDGIQTGITDWIPYA